MKTCRIVGVLTLNLFEIGEDMTMIHYNNLYIQGNVKHSKTTNQLLDTELF